jgi:peptidoglycan/xylan/chitin deacetylase (PgdA/CDA1 family)
MISMKSTPAKTIGNVSRTIAASIVAAILVMAFAGTTMRYAHAATATTPCNCVVFRIDDIQDWWIHDVQAVVLNTFITNDTMLTPGMIMNSYGSDPGVVDKVQEGKDAGLFELALHGWNHVDYATLSLKDQEQTLAEANAKLQTIHGEKSNIFIPPYDSLNRDTPTAMKDYGLGILSAHLFADNGFLPQTFPPADPSGIISIPYTVLYVEGSQPPGQNHKTLSQLLSEVNDSIANRGWAVVLLHPQDFAKWDGNGVAQNIVDADQMSTLVNLISQLNADGRTITSYRGLIDRVNSLPAPPDTTPPTGSIVTPSSNNSIVTLNTPFNVTGTASDDVAVKSVEVRAVNSADTDGTDYAQATTSDNFAHWRFNMSIPDRTFTRIEARITDTSGNQAWVASNVTVSSSGGPDTVKPSVTITSPTTGQSETAGSTITVTGTASDNVALQKVEVRATLPDDSDGTTYGQATLNGDGNWSFNLLLENSAFTTIVARATDTSGNQRWFAVSVTTN